MIDNPIIWFGVFPLVAYLIGSVPFGVLIARANGVDLRKVGSGNVGSTNVTRALGRRWGYLCFLLDVLKGLIPTLAAGWVIGAIDLDGTPPTYLQQGAWLGVGAGCVFGHVFSVYLRFRGGKGVATSLGVVLGIYPYFTWVGLVGFGLWGVVTVLTRYVSLGSIVACVAFIPLFVVFNYEMVRDLRPLGVFAAVIVAIILFRHRTNFRRLMQGTESKIGRKDKG